MLHRRLASLVSLGALSLGALSLGACATGAEDDGLGGLSGAYSAGVGEGSSDGGSETGGEGSEGGSGPATTTTGQPPSPGEDTGSDDGGNPLCCAAHPQAGCDSPATESCVCTSQPSCCQAVWTDDCADLAVACGDPFCEDDPSGGSTGGEGTGGEGTGGESTGEPALPPPEPPPFPACPCIDDPEVNNFCHYGPSHPGCPMTAPGGYCDPNGDGSFVEGNWDQGWFDWHAQCA